MKGKAISVVLVCALMILLVPLCASGQSFNKNFALKVGTYNPTGDLDDANFDPGLAVELTWSEMGSKNFSYEVGFGAYGTDMSRSDFVGGIGTVNQSADILITSLFGTLKYHVPFSVGDFYAGVGIDWLSAAVDYTISIPGDSLSYTDSDWFIFGGHLEAGLNFNLGERWFLGFEGKYLFTTDASFSDVDQGVPWSTDRDLTGYFLFGQIGYRY